MGCLITSCAKITGRFTAGYCNAHYLRLRRGKNPNTPSHKEKRGYIDCGDHIKIPLGINGRRGYAIADADMSWLGNYNWSLFCNRYARGVVNGKIVFMHHMVVGKHTSKGLVIDHKDRNSLNNRRSNLRIVLQSINVHNRALGAKKTSLYRGVSKVKTCRSWRATISNKHLGNYKTETDAAKAYDIAAVEKYGSYAVLNGV